MCFEQDYLKSLINTPFLGDLIIYLPFSFFLTIQKYLRLLLLGNFNNTTFPIYLSKFFLFVFLVLFC